MNDVIPDSAVIVSTGVLSVKSISVYDLQGRNIIGQQVGVMENEGFTVWLSFFYLLSFVQYQYIYKNIKILKMKYFYLLVSYPLFSLQHPFILSSNLYGPILNVKNLICMTICVLLNCTINITLPF